MTALVVFIAGVSFGAWEWLQGRRNRGFAVAYCFLVVAVLIVHHSGA